MLPVWVFGGFVALLVVLVIMWFCRFGYCSWACSAVNCRLVTSRLVIDGLEEFVLCLVLVVVVCLRIWFVCSCICDLWVGLVWV